ncbi:thioredoxin family protein [Candidatus Woesebacteria bacterium]|nr:thioredoxin family protein [Candidatus Woesebacteria bacterium]
MKHITQSEFKQEVIGSKGIVGVVIQTEWCEPCKHLLPVIESLEQKFAKNDIHFVSIDLDSNPSFTSYYRIAGLPTVIFFKDGVMSGLYMGVKTVEEFHEIVTSIIEGKKKKAEKSVKVFSTQTCPYCHMVKDYLTQKNVKFEDIDVSHDRNAATEMVQKSGQMGVPQLWIDGEVVVGYDTARINELLSR